ncbi:MAG: glycosyltransferase family 39 protein [Anaerolineales bacterium]|nr:glycosyltransferase family 39 protein [Anaerolineales bacterium]
MTFPSHKTSNFFLSLIVGASLTALILFNFPLVYEQPKLGVLYSFIILWMVFSITVGILYKPLYLVAFPIIKNKAWKDLFFIIALALFVVIAIYSASTYYWATPATHQIKICYYSDHPQQPLEIVRIAEAGGEHIYSADLFGKPAYPISIQANSCIGGGLRSTSLWQGLEVVNNIDASKTGDSLVIEVNQNSNKNIFNYQKDALGEDTTFANSGADQGIPIISSKLVNSIFVALKWFSLILGSTYLALFLFALSQSILVQKPGALSPKIALILILIYFFVFGIFMTKISGQPDQDTHNYFSTRFIETWGIPKDDPASSYFTKDNIYLYYWINGSVIKIYNALLPANATRIPNSQIWRFVSVILSAATIFYFYKLAKQVTNNAWGGVLAAFFGANTLMFVFVSSGVSYDNFMSLSAAASFYHLIKIIKKSDYIKHSALLGVWLCAGSLAKNQILLLAFILFSIWLFISIKEKLFLHLAFTRRHIAPLILLCLFAGLFSELYVGNLIRYKKPLPSCSQIKPDRSVCTNFSNRAQYRQEISYEDLWQNRNSIIGPVEYALNYWLFNAVNGIWGIISYQTFVPKFTTSFHALLILWTLLCLARYWRKQDAVMNVLMLAVAAYVIYVFGMNYKNELRYDFRHFAVQGRYLFPIFGAFLAIMINSFLQIRAVFIKRATLVLSIILYFSGGLGAFVFHYYDVFSAWTR